MQLHISIIKGYVLYVMRYKRLEIIRASFKKIFNKNSEPLLAS
ncbi:hypothetical protein SAMN05421876_103356 [Kaistella jeonii]|nr:hypothetical protein SAMN05421876_103356 [Kaistella jeonii]VEI95771.1 Uncharacterised protein [Kaistella jeonii]